MRKYENLNFIHENTMPPRSHYIPYDSIDKAKAGDKMQSDYYALLNGEWDFCYFARDIDCPDTITEWDKTDVPSCWQARGYEKPYYTNVNYPYPVDAPYVPDDNPVGVYRRTVTIDAKKAAMENYLGGGNNVYSSVTVKGGIRSEGLHHSLVERFRMICSVYYYVTIR